MSALEPSLPIPSWARYTAIDAHGIVLAFSHRPVHDADGSWIAEAGTYCRIGIAPEQAPLWRTSLRDWNVPLGERVPMTRDERGWSLAMAFLIMAALVVGLIEVLR